MPDGTTPLILSCRQGHLGVVHLLCSSRADPNTARESDGATPLGLALEAGHQAVAQLLAEYGAGTRGGLQAKDIAFSFPGEALRMAARSGDIEILRTLCGSATRCRPGDRQDDGAMLESGTHDGTTPLLFAAQEGHAEAVALLCEARADPFRMRKDGATPLSVAAHGGHVDVASILLDLGAEPDCSGNTTQDVTPLLLASREGHLEMVRALLAWRADPERPMSNGVTPLCISAHAGHLEVVRCLCEDGGASRDRAMPDGTTALLLALRGNHLNVVRYLRLAL